MVFLIAFCATLFVLVAFSVMSERAKSRALVAATSGSTRVESIKAQRVNRTVAAYSTAGWVVVDQTSAMPLDPQAKVTITFLKL